MKDMEYSKIFDADWSTRGFKVVEPASTHTGYVFYEFQGNTISWYCRANDNRCFYNGVNIASGISTIERFKSLFFGLTGEKLNIHGKH